MKCRYCGRETNEFIILEDDYMTRVAICKQCHEEMLMILAHEDGDI